MRQSVNQQQGFTLFMVMILMAVIAILVLAGSQLLNTEMRLSSNDADKKYAFGLAEDALRHGEQYAYLTVHKENVLKQPDIIAGVSTSNIQSFFTSSIVSKTGGIFNEACTNGLCAPSIESGVTAGTVYSTIPAWERQGDDGKGNQVNIFETAASEKKWLEYDLGATADVSKDPRFIVEYLGPAESTDTTLYRITARAWGRNQNTQVTLQSVIRVVNS